MRVPELPEVETITRDLAASITGARVAAVWGSGLPLRLARPVDLAGIRKVAQDRRIVSIRRKAKYLLLDFEAAPGPDPSPRPGILFHLGMSGRLLVESVLQPRPRHTQLALSFTDGRELRFRDPRRFGFVAAGAPIDGRAELADLGPDAWAELDAAGLTSRLQGVRAPIKAFLLDQTRVAGLGNIYACEALHWAGIHPATPAGRTRGRAAALLEGIRTSLSIGITNRGTTLRDYVDSSGARGNNAGALRVYGRAGQACPRCAGVIVRSVHAARSTFFCARCQHR